MTFCAETSNDGHVTAKRYITGFLSTSSPSAFLTFGRKGRLSLSALGLPWSQGQYPLRRHAPASCLWVGEGQRGGSSAWSLSAVTISL